MLSSLNSILKRMNTTILFLALYLSILYEYNSNSITYEPLGRFVSNLDWGTLFKNSKLNFTGKP